MKRVALLIVVAAALPACSSDGDADPTVTTVTGRSSSTGSSGGTGAPASTAPAAGGPVDPNELSTRRLDQIETELDRAEAALDRLERR